MSLIYFPVETPTADLAFVNSGSFFGGDKLWFQSVIATFRDLFRRVVWLCRSSCEFQNGAITSDHLSVDVRINVASTWTMAITSYGISIHGINCPWNHGNWLLWAGRPNSFLVPSSALSTCLHHPPCMFLNWRGRIRAPSLLSCSMHLITDDRNLVATLVNRTGS